MNNEEAIKEIEYALEKLKTHVAWEVDMEALKVAKKALEKQIPQQVKKVRHETILGYAETYFCPKCGGSVWKNTDECKYCFRCGQAIDWEANNG